MVGHKDAPRPGWLALVSNGGGGFWYDVLGEYTDALYTSLTALDDLSDAGPASEPLAAALPPLQHKLALQADAVEDAMTHGKD